MDVLFCYPFIYFYGVVEEKRTMENESLQLGTWGAVGCHKIPSGFMDFEPLQL